MSVDTSTMASLLNRYWRQAQVPGGRRCALGPFALTLWRPDAIVLTYGGLIMMGNYGWNGGGMNVEGWVLMAVLMVLFCGGVFAVVFALVRHSAFGRNDPPLTGASENSALRVLEERFARGDIDMDEYTERRDLLRPREHQPS